MANDGLTWLSGLGPLKIGLLIVAALGVTVGGAFAIGVIGTPDVVGVENSFGNVSEEVTEIHTDLELYNPNPIGIALGGLSIDYEVRMNGITMAHGGREGIEIERGNSSVDFSTDMDNDKLPEWWVSHLRNDENTTLEVHADVHSSAIGRTFEAPAVERTIDTDLVEAFNSEEERELNANMAAVTDPVLIVRETRGEWGSVSESETEIRMEFVVFNPREFPVTLTDIGYDIAMNEVTMGTGETEQSYVIPPGEEETITATFRLDNRNLDEWWVTHIQNDQKTRLTADFYLRLDLSAVGAGDVRIPLDTMEQTIETDIFGEAERDGTNGNGTNGDGTNGGESDGGESDGDESDDDGADGNGSDGEDDDAETETETETATPTETETEDDDGGIGLDLGTDLGDVPISTVG